MKKFLVFLVIFSSSLFAGAVEYPKLSNFVTDTADMIDPAWEASINNLARQIEENTTAEIAVVTVPSLEGMAKEQYAVELFENAGIGKKDKNNGLLILVAEAEREYRFEVGYGLEPYVTDSMYVTIGKQIIEPNFREGEYGRGIFESVEVVGALISGQEDVLSKYQMPTGGQTQKQEPLWNVISLLFFIFMIYLFSKGGFFPLFFFGGPRVRMGGGWSSSGGFGGGGFGGFGGGFSGGGGFGGSW